MSDPLDFLEENAPATLPVNTAAPPAFMSDPAPPRVAMPYLEDLNPAQRAAVEALDGPVLVLAGAGTGKTRVLTTRLVHLLTTRRAAPYQVLAVTFTNKAAREMRERVGHLLGTPTEGWWMGTFHALAARILRRHAECVGLRSNFTILDTDDQQRLLKQLLEAARIDSKTWPVRRVLGVIDRWKDRGLTADQLGSNADIGQKAGREDTGGWLVTLYRQYQERLLTLNASDFGNLLLHNLTLFQNFPDILREWHHRFRYLLVDEYQDTNVAQYLWLRLLAQGHGNICCVGDDDQSIYGWRGAEVANILRFEHDFPGATLVRLEQNYRSTGHILGAASGLIAHNQGRHGKTLWTRADAGAPVRVQGVWDGQDEARWVGEEIETLQRRTVRLNQIAVLVRAGFQTRTFEERFLTLGLPYRVLGGTRFYERQEIRDALAYFRIIHQPDDDLAFERIINVPKRGIGPATLQQLFQSGREQTLSLTEATWRLTETGALKPKIRQTLRNLLQDIHRWRGLAERIRHTDLARMVLDESGYTGMWQADKSPEAAGRLDNLKELITAMAEFENLEGFLEHVALVMENADASGDEMVSLMTLHGAKGLEFDHVFLPGWEEGLFPSQRAMDENGLAGLEEERRLAYVGLTRARLQAYIVHAGNRLMHGSWMSALPSRFIEELPEAHTQTDSTVKVVPEGFTSPGFRERDGGNNATFRHSAFRESERTTRHDSGTYGGHNGGISGGFTATRRTAPPVITGTARTVPSQPRTGLFKSGDRVFHPSFGYGTVNNVEGDKLAIVFDQGPGRMILSRFVTPAAQAPQAGGTEQD